MFASLQTSLTSHLPSVTTVTHCDKTWEATLSAESNPLRNEATNQIQAFIPSSNLSIQPKMYKRDIKRHTLLSIAHRLTTCYYKSTHSTTEEPVTTSQQIETHSRATVYFLYKKNYLLTQGLTSAFRTVKYSFTNLTSLIYSIEPKRAWTVTKLQSWT